MLPSNTLIDFASRMFVVELTSTRGKVLYRASLDAGALSGDLAVGRFTYKNNSAKASGGLARVRISRHRDGYRLTATTYGNLLTAGANMVTRVYSQGAQWNVHGTWQETRRGWKFVE